LGRFLSIDPLSSVYPWNSPYAFAENKVIQFIELEGAEVYLSRAQRAEYGGGFSNPVATFTYNSVVSAYNGFVDVFNYAGDLTDPNAPLTGLKYGAKKLKEDAKNSYSEVKDYLNNNTIGDVAEDVGGALQKVETYENIAGGLIAGAATKGTRMLSSVALVNTRKFLARSFYEKFKESNIDSKLNAIDFDKPVQTITLKKGTVIQQWVDPKSGKGKYFSPLDSGDNVGIPNVGDRVLQEFTLTKDTKVLKSTTSDYKGTKGGETQYFSPELKANTELVK
jgi:hypothetical protein